MSSTNRGGERIALDAYYTIDPVARACVATLGDIRGLTAWEPHAGGGGFVRALAERGALVTASDIDPDAPGLSEAWRSYIGSVDFLTQSVKFDWIVGNSPYTDAEAHVRHAIVNASIGVAFLLRLAFLETPPRDRLFREFPASEVHVLVQRPSFTGNGKTDSCAYGWFIWRKGHSGPTILRHLNWKS